MRCYALVHTPHHALPYCSIAALPHCRTAVPQVAIHAIGDRAVDDVIEVYGEALGVAALMPDAQQEAEDQERQQQQQQQHYQQQQQRKLQDTSDQGTKKAVTQDAHEDDVASAVGMEGTADGGAGAGTTAEAGGGRTHSGGPHGGDGGGGGGKCPFGFDRMAEAAARVYETEGGEGPWGAAGAAREEQQRRRMQRLGDRLRLRIEHVQVRGRGAGVEDSGGCGRMVLQRRYGTACYQLFGDGLRQPQTGSRGADALNNHLALTAAPHSF